MLVSQSLRHSQSTRPLGVSTSRGFRYSLEYACTALSVFLHWNRVAIAGYYTHAVTTLNVKVGAMAKKKGTALLVVFTDVDSEQDADFNAWYNEEHLPERLSGRDSWTALGTRRSRVVHAT